MKDICDVIHLSDTIISWKIYEEQKTNNDLNDHLKKLLVFVYQHLVSEASNSLISEYAKRESSWKKLKDGAYSVNLIEVLKNIRFKGTKSNKYYDMSGLATGH